MGHAIALGIATAAAERRNRRVVAEVLREDGGQVTLGVMLFKGLGPEGDKDWRREALRDGLNAQLSQVVPGEGVLQGVHRLPHHPQRTDRHRSRHAAGHQEDAVGELRRGRRHAARRDARRRRHLRGARIIVHDLGTRLLQTTAEYGFGCHLPLEPPGHRRRTPHPPRRAAECQRRKPSRCCWRPSPVRAPGLRRPGQSGREGSPRSELPCWLASLDSRARGICRRRGGAAGCHPDVLEHYRKATESREIPRAGRGVRRVLTGATGSAAALLRKCPRPEGDHRPRRRRGGRATKPWRATRAPTTSSTHAPAARCTSPSGSPRSCAAANGTWKLAGK